MQCTRTITTVKPRYLESGHTRAPGFSNYIRSPSKNSTVLHLKCATQRTISTVKPCYFEFLSYESPGFFELYPKSQQKLRCIAQSRKSEKSNTRVSPKHQITSLTSMLFNRNTRGSHLSVGFHTFAKDLTGLQ